MGLDNSIGGNGVIAIVWYALGNIYKRIEGLVPFSKGGD